MDADVDSVWICTQAIVSTDSQTDVEQEKINNYGYIVLNDMIENERYVLKEGDNTIGRHPLNHIYIEHPSVSMNHAVIQCDSDGVVLLDKGSLNKTKLNKKILRKNVAYFLEENALLMFGEVQADYFINEKSIELKNDTKSMAPDNTSVHKTTQNNGLSLSKLSNAVITSKSSRTDIPKAITDYNASLVIENKSTCKIEKEVLKTIIGTECTMNTLNDIHTKLNSSSPSDEYLLEALSQVETKQNNVNTNEIFQSLSDEDSLVMNLTESVSEIIREDTPSPVMDLKSSILTTNQVTKNQFQSPNKINTEAIREDTPSPVMDLKSFILTTNNIPKNIFQSPSKINKELIREDTPSPIMDFGCCNDFENNLETNNPGIISAIQSPNEVDKFNNTQVLEIDSNIVELYIHTSNNDDAQKVESGEQSIIPIKNCLDIHSNDNLSGSNNINLSTNGNNTDKHKIIVNTFEADDDDVFRHFIEKECKSQQHELAILENQDFFNCPTQKVTIKRINIQQKVTSSIHDKETQNLIDLSKSIKNNASASKSIHEDLTQIPKMDDDFFNCSTQKLSITKKINPKQKLSSSIHDKETQELLEFSKPCKSNSILLKSYSTSIHEENTEIPKVDDDFFNCPTQKLSTAKKVRKITSSIHDEETQELIEFSKPCKSNSIVSKSYSTSIREENTEIPKIDDDFFNCPTQKLSTSKNIYPNTKVSPSIHEKETQRPPEFSQLDKSNNIASNTYSTNIDKDLTEVPEMDDDFFNYPTQKVSTAKKVRKVTSSINDEETQELIEFSKPCKSNSIVSKSYSTSIHEENTQIPDIDDDFFYCPTQKLSISKNMFPKPKVSLSVHDVETQRPPEFSQFDKSNNIAPNTYSTDIDKDLTEVPEMDDDFFNCPTQKISTSKKVQPKVTSSIHDEETQELLEFSKPSKSNSIVLKSYSTSIHEENTQNPNIDDDFFNCPTQRVSITKKVNLKPEVSPSIHEKETQRPPEFSQLDKSNNIASNTYSTNIDKDLTEVPEIDDNFFNYPTQKVSTAKKVRKVTSSINDEETQELIEFSKPCKSNSIVSKSYSTSIHEENTQIPDIDDDFFYCPTQKLSISKNMFPKPKVSLSVHEVETQRPPEFSQFDKSNNIAPNTYSTNIDKDLTEVPEMDDDFFNCPTQKISTSKKVQPKVTSSIHDEETQELIEFSKPCKSNSIVSKSYSTSIHEENTQNPNIDDDFFNCPTQKVSITKKINLKPKVSLSFHEEETQRPPELSQFNKTSNIASNTYSTNIDEDLTMVPEIDDDFFNCPTQKLSSAKKVQPKVTSSIQDEETQDLLEFSKPCKSNSIVSKSYSTSIHEENTQNPNIDDDFFNCPTQRVSITKKINPKPKVSLSIHEEETQRPPEFSQFNKTSNIASNNYSTNIDKDLTEVPEMDDDFFNCPTQKLSTAKKVKPKVTSSIQDEDTQELLEFSKPCKSNSIVSKSYSTSMHEENTQNPNIDDDFFNCPTQRVSITKKINPKPKVSLSIHEEETQRPPEFSRFDKTSKIASNNYSTNRTEVPEMDNDFFNCPTQQLLITKKINPKPIVSSSIHEEETQRLKVQSKSISNCSMNKNEDITKNPEHSDGSYSHKETVVRDNEDRCKVQKSKFDKSNIISLSNVQLPVMCNGNSSNSLRTNKSKIRGTEDMSYPGGSSNNSTIILNKPNKNTVFNNINTTVPFNKNFDSPGCSKTTTIKKNDLNAPASTKQECFIDDSDQSQVSIPLKYNNHMKQMDESIFIPLNIPDVSANSLLEDHSSPLTIENNLNTLKCEPSTSSNNAYEWKSFWNKKKVQSQDKEKIDKQKSIKIAPEVKENKERYQTRAITRKRKQNGIVESNKKLCNRSNILEPLVENSSEIVVSFSYLKSRHLQEMKQFVEKTGGTVTDDITQCTVLVTNKIQCTMKILSAIAKGCPIVNANWLKHSYTVKMFQDVDDFIIADKDAERKYKFQLKESLAKAKTKRLLDGYNVLVTPSVKPGPQEMKVIITCAGGNFVLNWNTPQYTKELIVTCDKDRTRWKPAWDNDLAKIIDSDTLVKSIIRQQLSI